MEGGLGDHFIANRLISAIKEMNPHCNMDLFSDTEGNVMQSEILNTMWPSYFNETYVIPSKQFKSFKIESSNFPPEDYPGHLDNVPDDYWMLMQDDKIYDKFYDLHIDSLKWLNHDYPWFKYFHHFPKPERNICLEDRINLPSKFIMAHLYARPTADSNMEEWYVKKFLNNIIQDYNVVLICEEKYREYYEKIIDTTNPKITLFSGNMEEIFYISSKCEIFVGIDSGIKYIPYHYGKPVFTFSKYCKTYGEVQFSYLIRWLLFDKHTFPLHFDIKTATQIIKNCMRNPAYQLYPFLLDNIEQLVAQREETKWITEE